MAYTPIPGVNAYIAVASQAVVAVAPGPNGGLIVNPAANTDQGLAVAEPLYVDPVGVCGQLAAGGTIIALQPGESWALIPTQTTPTYVNAQSAGHKFTVVSW